MLLALVIAQRTQTFTNLDTRLIQVLSDKIVVHNKGKPENKRPGKHLSPNELLAFNQDLRICPVTDIQHYIATTQTLRQATTLLVSYTTPHKAFTNSTIARWVKSTLKDTSIDGSTFSAHSSRTAA